MTRRRVVALSPVPVDGAGCRFRLAQHVPHLAASGFDVRIAPFYTTEFFELAYTPGHHVRKTVLTLQQTSRRLRDLRNALDTDLVWIYRETYPIGPPWLEYFLARKGGPALLYDFDDAVFLPNTSDANRMVSVFKWPEKVGTIVQWSDQVIAGNRYLADFAQRHNTRVRIIPTCVDTTQFVPERSERTGLPTLGWIGTPTTSTYLQTLAPALQTLSRSHRYTLRVSGAGRQLAIPGVTVSDVPWTLEDEVGLFNTCDVGLYPLPDDPWTRGKCGFKAIQFMACGVPVVASPVGVNNEIIEDGVNGFLADTPDEWVDKVGHLLDDPVLRRMMGDAGRATVEDRYSLEVNAPKIVEAFEQALASRADRKGRPRA